MADKFQDKYRIPSARAGWWDYGKDAACFVTINADNMKNHYFGHIRHGEMQLSAIGRIARDIWQEIPHKFPLVLPDVFVIMPNHVHGIIVINKSGNIAEPQSIETRLIASLPNQSQPPKPPGGITGKHNPMLGTGLGRIIRWYKGRVTFESRKHDPLFAWQARYYDHIIREDESYQRIVKYIIHNPAIWPVDKFYSS